MRPPAGKALRHIRAIRALLAAAACAGLLAPAPAVEVIDSMRRAPILDTTAPPVLQNSDNSDVRRSRNYAMQPRSFRTRSTATSSTRMPIAACSATRAPVRRRARRP